MSDPSTIYMLFAGSMFYPEGGTEDLAGMCVADSHDEAIEQAQAILRTPEYSGTDWHYLAAIIDPAVGTVRVVWDPHEFTVVGERCGMRTSCAACEGEPTHGTRTLDLIGRLLAPDPFAAEHNRQSRAISDAILASSEWVPVEPLHRDDPATARLDVDDYHGPVIVADIATNTASRAAACAAGRHAWVSLAGQPSRCMYGCGATPD